MPRFAAIFLLCLLLAPGAGLRAAELFGYRELRQADITPFTQWLGVLERHITEDVPEADCSERRFNRCHLRQWRDFLAGLRGRPLAEQLQAVNAYANRKQYVLDIDNYGVADYWAVAREFLYNGGDCEDYAITKLFSLLWLGVAPERMRLVVLQDTNLRIPHAVLAVFSDDGRTLILDNQIQAVVEDRSIVHYVPVYSINQQAWWIHTPRS